MVSVYVKYFTIGYFVPETPLLTRPSIEEFKCVKKGINKKARRWGGEGRTWVRYILWKSGVPVPEKIIKILPNLRQSSTTDMVGNNHITQKAICLLLLHITKLKRGYPG